MLKKTYLGVILVAVLIGVLTFVVVGTIAQIISTKNDEMSLDMKAQITGGTFRSVGDVTVDIVFQNNEDESVRLLNIFDDAQAKQVFFSISLSDSNGTPIITTGGGKISLSEDSMKYIELKKGEKYVSYINLKDFLPVDYRLKSGSYDVSITYRNQYGEDCFKGSLKSNITKLSLSD